MHYKISFICSGQDLLNTSLHFGLKNLYSTPHGSSDTTILVFDIPANVQKPYLMVNGESLLGDVFNAGKTSEDVFPCSKNLN